TVLSSAADAMPATESGGRVVAAGLLGAGSELEDVDGGHSQRAPSAPSTVPPSNATSTRSTTPPVPTERRPRRGRSAGWCSGGGSPAGLCHGRAAGSRQA